MSDEQIAAVVLRLGRYWLVVRGMYVAMEGDPCHDPAWPDKYWTQDSLRAAADQINANRFGSAGERLSGRGER